MNTLISQQLDSTKCFYGSCLGSKADAEAVARGLIERYMDAPGRCFIKTLPASGGGFHYEVQQGCDTSYLKSLLAQLDAETSENPVVVVISSERQVKVSRKDDGGLLCFWLPDDERYEAGPNQILEPRRSMKPYMPAGRWLEYASRAALTIGLAVFVAGASSYTIKQYVHAGYAEAVALAAPETLRDLAGIQASADPSPDEREALLPISQWSDLKAKAKNNQYVTKLSFEHDSGWRVEIDNMDAHSTAKSSNPPSQEKEG